MSLVVFSALIVVIFTVLKLKTVYNYRNVHNQFNGSKLNFVQKLCYGSMTEFAQIWNGYEVHGLENVSNNNCLLIGYHSRTTLDLLYLQSYLQGHVLVTYLLFYIPVFGSLLYTLGAVPSKSKDKEKAEDGFVQILSKGSRPLILLPGGAFECMKRFEDIGVVQWKKLPGFARLIESEGELLGSHTRVVPFYTKHCEHCLWTSPWWYTHSGALVRNLMDRIGRGHLFVLPLLMVMLMMSLGFFLVPLPVKMDTYFAKPLSLRPGENGEQFALRVAAATNALIAEVDALPERPFPHGRPGIFTLATLGVYTAIHTLVLNAAGGVLFLLIGLPLVTVYQTIMKIFFHRRRNKED